MEFSRPRYWSRWPFLSPGDLPNPGIEPRSPALQVDSLLSEPRGKPKNTGVGSLSLLQQIFPTQGSNGNLLHFRQILYHLSHQGVPTLYLKPLSFGGFPHSSVGEESAFNAGDPSSIPGSGRSPGEEIGYPLQYSWASLVAQLIKNPPAVWETWVPSLCWEDPLEKGKATHSSILAWRIPWTV